MAITRFTMPHDGSLSPEMVASFDHDGCLILQSFASQADCRKLIDRANLLVANFDASEHATVFSTLTQEHARDDYFAESGDKIRFFFEDDALDDAGRLLVPKQQSINKIGHALHDLDPVFTAFSHDRRLDVMARQLGLTVPKILQSMYIFKQPGIGGEVVCHQDAPFLYTDPISVTGFWLALEEASLENGCLSILRGQHLGGLRSRFRRVGERLETEILNAEPWAMENAAAVEVAAGTLVVLHGLLPHLSNANRSEKSRHAYVVHAIDGNADYPADNWLQRGPDMPLRGFL